MEMRDTEGMKCRRGAKICTEMVEYAVVLQPALMDTMWIWYIQYWDGYQEGRNIRLRPCFEPVNSPPAMIFIFSLAPFIFLP